MTAFLSSGPFRDAYLGKHAYSLVMQTSAQMEDVYEARGLTIPLRVSSVLHFLAANEGAAMADIAASLDLPHQLVAQRVAKLLDSGLVERRRATDDARRVELYLTEAGRDQAARLVECMRDTADVYRDLFAEIDCHLVETLLKAASALEAKPLAVRFSEKFVTQETE